jgi:membrane-associated phospholipid phosphatase
VAERHYGWKVGLPAYSLAGLVAVSRLQRNKHYLSDVLAGATLGYIAGRAVVRVNDRALGSSKLVLTLEPLLGHRTGGLVVGVSF